MSVAAIAKKDFRDAIRSRAFWAVSALFLLLTVGIAIAYATLEGLGRSDAGSTGLVFFLAGAIGSFVALAAVLACYKAIAGERERGTIKIMLALPHSRQDVVLGKVLGRAAVLAVPVVIGLVLATIAGGLLLGDVAPVATVVLGLLGAVFILTYASIMVGLSATTGSTTRASILTVGFFFVVEMFWSVVLVAANFVANGFAMPEAGAPPPDWIYVLNLLPPSSAFSTSLATILDPPLAAGVTTGSQFDAFYTEPWFALAVLAVWLVAPVSLGYWRFAAADI